MELGRILVYQVCRLEAGYEGFSEHFTDPRFPMPEYLIWSGQVDDEMREWQGHYAFKTLRGWHLQLPYSRHQMCKIGCRFAFNILRKGATHRVDLHLFSDVCEVESE